MKQIDPLAELRQSKGYWWRSRYYRYRIKLSVFFYELAERLSN